MFSSRFFVLIANARGCVKGCKTLSAARAETAASGKRIQLVYGGKGSCLCHPC